MKHKIFKVFVDHEKEEKWLNEMAAKGMYFVHYSFCRYTFEEGKPGEYQYRIELLENLPSHPESRNYISFMEDNGVEYVDSYFRWVFFRKKAADGAFNLYSDADSRISHYNKIAGLVGVFAAVNLFGAVSNTMAWLAVGNHEGSIVNFYISFLNWAVLGMLGYILYINLKRIRNLKKEKLLFE